LLAQILKGLVLKAQASKIFIKQIDGLLDVYL
jgi:hypothetical protein